MSQADIERLTRDLQSNEQLRNEIKSGASGIASIVEIAKRHGYDVTVDEVKAYMRGQSTKDLNDDQLEALAGGAGDTPQTMSTVLANVITQVNTSSTSVVTTSGPAAYIATVVAASGPTSGFL